MNEEFITFDSNLEKIKETVKEAKYQHWKKSIEMLGEELGFRWRICDDIFYRSAWLEYLGIGINLRDIFFNQKKLEL